MNSYIFTEKVKQIILNTLGIAWQTPQDIPKYLDFETTNRNQLNTLLLKNNTSSVFTIPPLVNIMIDYAIDILNLIQESYNYVLINNVCCDAVINYKDTLYKSSHHDIILKDIINKPNYTYNLEYEGFHYSIDQLTGLLRWRSTITIPIMYNKALRNHLSKSIRPGDITLSEELEQLTHLQNQDLSVTCVRPADIDYDILSSETRCRNRFITFDQVVERVINYIEQLIKEQHTLASNMVIQF